MFDQWLLWGIGWGVKVFVAGVVFLLLTATVCQLVDGIARWADKRDGGRRG